MYVYYKNWPFSDRKVLKSGFNVGKYIYRRLFYIENCLRIIVHTALVSEINVDWWEIIIPERRKEDVALRRSRHYMQLRIRESKNAPWFHGIYYITLSELKQIAWDNKTKINNLIPDFEAYIIDFETVINPRNFVCHMNYAPYVYREKIRKVHRQTNSLLQNLITRVPLVIP